MWWEWLCLIIIFFPPFFVILMMILDALDPDAYINSYIRAEKKAKEKESWKNYKKQTSFISMYKDWIEH